MCNLEEINETDVMELTRDHEISQPVIVFFIFAPWCDDCNNIGLLYFHQAAKKYSDFVYSLSVSIDKLPGVTKAIFLPHPVYMFLKNRRLVYSLIGRRDPDEIGAIIQDLLYF